MAVSSRSCLIHFTLLLLLSSSCAWANDGARSWPLEGAAEGHVGTGEVMASEHNAGDEMPLWRRVGVEIREVVDHVDKLAERRHEVRSPLPTRAAEHADKRVREACMALITPAPSLAERQDNGQIQALSNQLQQLSQQSRAVSQASQQVSQESQQLSQSLQQANQQLSQTRDQLASARAQSSAASQAAQQASEAARQASEAAAQASNSANSAIASAQASASDAVNANMARFSSAAGASVASAIALASASAVSAANNAASMIKQAQADATAVRNEASNQVQQAQGTAVSVTQAALAIVGAIIGSSLITILAFMLILRYRRLKRRQSQLSGQRSNISYPRSNDGYTPSNYDNNSFADGPRAMGANGYPVDLKEPQRAASIGGGPMGLQRTNSASSNGSLPRMGMGVGYATSDFNSNAGPNPNESKEFTLKDAPKGKFSLFPRPKDEPTAATSGALLTGSSTTSGPPGSTGSPKSQRGSKIFPPSLDTWLRAGTVSPFGTLPKDKSKEKNSEWPMPRREWGP